MSNEINPIIGSALLWILSFGTPLLTSLAAGEENQKNADKLFWFAAALQCAALAYAYYCGKHS